MFVEIPTRAGGFYRLVKNNTHVPFNGLVWTATSMSIELPEENQDGRVAGVQIAIPNVSRIPLALVDQPAGDSQFGELLGQLMTCYLANESHLASATNAVTWRSRITDITATAEVLSVSAGAPDGVARVPSRVYDREQFPQLLPPEEGLQ